MRARPSLPLVLMVLFALFAFCAIILFKLILGESRQSSPPSITAYWGFNESKPKRFIVVTRGRIDGEVIYPSFLNYRSLADSTGIAATLEGTSSITDGRWHHLAVIRDKSMPQAQVPLYVDGMAEHTAKVRYMGNFSNSR